MSKPLKLAVPGAVCGLLLAGFVFGGPQFAPAPQEPAVVRYDAALYPNLDCLDGRIIAETQAGLGDGERAALWREHQLEPTFEWINHATGFSYHELEIRQPRLLDRIIAGLGLAERPEPTLRERVERLDDDRRVNWAVPDALALVWSQGGPHGASLLDGRYQPFDGTLADWLTLEDRQDPYPDFEYYRLCSPEGTPVGWAGELAESDGFMQSYGMAYGTNQARALAGYQANGSPELAPVTVCVADTGVYFNHPDLQGRMHPNSIDANYRNYAVSDVKDRAAADIELTDRYDERAVGLPREAIKGRPASHGTAVAGIIQRCTDGFNTSTGPIRLLPASIKSEKALVFTGYRVKSPISSFIKLVNCLAMDFPVGDFSYQPDDRIHNNGDVRVVSVSASVPKTMFSDAEWRVVATLIGKAQGSIAEDLATNDRLYVFAAGNDAQGEANKPGDAEFVLSVSATSAYDGAQAWAVPLVNEGANLAANCVSAPGYGIITSTIYQCPNLKYLPLEEFRVPRRNWATPPRDMTWEQQTPSFSATSAATPQVSSLAALLYAQLPERGYTEVIQLIRHNTGGREVSADWGRSLGIIDYSATLGW